MLVVVESASDARQFIRLAHTSGIEAKECGKITYQPTPTLYIHSTFDSDQRVLRYH
jgi:hypothetical protein